MRHESLVSSAARLHRRDLLRVGGAGLLGLNLPLLLNAEDLKASSQIVQGTSGSGKAKSVIFLFQWGGPSHVDMFDMKPQAPMDIGLCTRRFRRHCPAHLSANISPRPRK